MRRIKTAIIIGSSGQDGVLLIDKLSLLQYNIIEINKGNFDITNSLAVSELILRTRPDEIYFLAAYHHSSEDPLIEVQELLQKSLQINTISLVNFLEAIRIFSKESKIFYASSSLIYSSSEDILTENSRIDPGCPYSISKVVGMFTCKVYRSKYGVFASTGILFNHESVHRKNGFVSKKISKFIVDIVQGKNAKLKIGNINAIVDWGYACDFVDAMHMAMQLDNSDEFIIATGIQHTVKEYLEIAFAYVGLNYEDYTIIDSETITREPTIRIGDPSKFQYLTGWSTSISFEEMVCKLIDDEFKAQTIEII